MEEDKTRAGTWSGFGMLDWGYLLRSFEVF